MFQGHFTKLYYITVSLPEKRWQTVLSSVSGGTQAVDWISLTEVGTEFQARDAAAGNSCQQLVRLPIITSSSHKKASLVQNSVYKVYLELIFRITVFLHIFLSCMFCDTLIAMWTEIINNKIATVPHYEKIIAKCFARQCVRLKLKTAKTIKNCIICK